MHARRGWPLPIMIGHGLEVVVPGSIWHARHRLAWGPLSFRTRMTVVRLADGALWVHSPVPPLPSITTALAGLGTVRYIMAPNRGHHLYVEPFLEAFPGAEVIIAEGLRSKRPDLAGHTVLDAATAERWRPELEAIHIGGLPALDETVWFHAPTGSLIVADLLFCFGNDNPPLTRLAARLVGVFERLAMSRSMRLFIRDRAALGRAAQRLCSLEVERVIVAHDRIVDVEAARKLRAALAFLLPPAPR